MREQDTQRPDRAGERGPSPPSLTPRAEDERALATQTSPLTATIHREMVGFLCANDPSAGSPTETLLRLLLPLSDKVH